MTPVSLVAIDTASGRFRRYRRGPANRAVCTHELQMEWNVWLGVLDGSSTLEAGSLERLRLAIGYETCRVAPDPGSPSPQPPRSAA